MRVGTTGFVGKVLSRAPITQTFKLPIFDDIRVQARGGTEFFRTAGLGAEPEHLGAFSVLISNDDVVWDIGASVGLYSLIAARNGASAVAYEPDPSVAGRLRGNLALNAFASGVEVREVALADEPGELLLHSDGIDGLSGSLVDLGRHSNAVSVEVSTIDSEVERLGKSPTVLKIDIEGAEHQALLGGQHLLHSENAPRLIFIEIHPPFLLDFGVKPEQVEQLLEDAQYVPISMQKRNAEWVSIWLRH